MKDQKVTTAYKQTFGGEHRFFAAPGRVNLIGEHTDYNEGFVLPAAIDKKIYLAIAPLKGAIVKIYSVDYNESVEFNIHEPDVKNLPHWALYPYGVFKEIQGAGYFIEGFQAVFGGDIPTGAGLSSSAALETVFAVALNTIFKLQMDPLTLAKIGQLAEHNFAGVQCGIMDQFASVFGKQDHAILLDCRSLEHEYFPIELKEYELLLIDTRVKHSLASSEYNIRRAECEEGLKKLQTIMKGVKSLRDVRSSDVLQYEELLGEKIFLRCLYVAEENERVIETCQALERSDMQRVGELLYLSHEGLKLKYDVSCEELDLLVEIARETQGVMGARMMGGGFGGCTINLVKSSAVEAFKEKATATFAQAFGNPPEFYAVNVSKGAGEIE